MIEIVTTYKDNQFLSEKIVKGIEAKQFTHPEWWRVYGLGEYGQISETIFTNWKQIDKIPEDSKLIGYSTDFGFTNDPTAIVEVRMQDGNIYLKELVYELGLTNRDISKKYEECGIIRGFDDIIADSAEPKSIHELRQAGWHVIKAPKGPDSINKGIDIMKQYPIFITADSINLIKEFRMYRWDKDKHTGKTINKPVGVLDHGIDGVRYVCLAKLNKKKRFLKQWN
jgi:phage terminase large subunit